MADSANFKDNELRLLPYTLGNSLHTSYPPPNTGEVLVWLYDVHKLWIIVTPTVDCYFSWKVIDVQCDPQNEIKRPQFKEPNHFEYANPFEALEAAIEHCLNNILL